jgi:hypothetical protein
MTKYDHKSKLKKPHPIALGLSSINGKANLPDRDI